MHIVIIGNGVAGNSVISAVRKFRREASLTVISEEAFPHYSACVLADYLSGHLGRERVFLKTPEDYRAEGVDLLLGERVLEIDAGNKQVVLHDRNIRYDRLVIATGSRPIVPRLEGIGKPGVFTLKSLADADQISDYNGEKAVVVGAGAIGIEAAIALRQKGWRVTLVELWDGILPRAFDAKPALMLRQRLEANGIEVFTGERLTGVNGGRRVQGICTDQREIPCDMVILALGMRPETGLAQQAGIAIGDLGGIKVDRTMLTSIEDVYACGDCVQSPDIVTGKDTLSLLWHNAREQGEVAGSNCAGVPRRYPGALNMVGLNIFGIHAVSVGHVTSDFKGASLGVIERSNHDYHRLLLADGAVVGAQFIGGTDVAGAIASLIRRSDNFAALESIINNGELLRRDPWLYRLRPYVGCTMARCAGE